MKDLDNFKMKILTHFFLRKKAKRSKIKMNRKRIYPFPSWSLTKRKNKPFFLFSHFFVVPQKVYKTFIKPFEARQRILKMKI